MAFKRNICKFLLKHLGGMLPLQRHPGGKLGNRIRCRLAKGIVKQMGDNCIVEPRAEIMEGCVLGNRTGIGPDCLIGPNTIFKGHSLMAPNVHIFTTGHHYDEEKHRFWGQEKIKSVTIGENVWLGYGVTILSGVTIGNNVIIGAGSVVTKDIPNGVMAAGNPCVVKKVIDKEIFEEKEF